jgi:hypothetical protein
MRSLSSASIFCGSGLVDIEIARLLVAAGADPSLRSNYPPYGSAQEWLAAAISWASESGMEEVARE